ncbi:ATPase, T2SS/T4P/T4SS family [Serratia sp. UGAL515B_01]|uniref:ATPase, T2SS/T4P/T4SS family n=1 Tax=Serratia sp. UGAL515B_01 TaxID=2986763 RepID=UPI0029532708|nr:ATPase, T2SS/T4P/T4SS family [Serratia sp. UGAL515B_01]WON76954.1 GspE family protein [Serratia sp. UGAL515B_01]
MNDFFISKLEDIEFSDLMILPDERAFFRHVTGLEGPITEIPPNTELFHEIKKIKSELDQEKHHEFFYQARGVPFRATRIKTLNGVGYFLRRPKFPVPSIESLGYVTALHTALCTLGVKQGLVVFAGATGSGKSTSVYSLVSKLVSTHGDIVVGIEDPPEIPVQGIYGEKNNGLWYQLDASQSGGYESAMIAAMRYNPRYIMMGEIRSPMAAGEAIRAAVNGHLVLTTIHGNSIIGAILAIQQIAAAGLQSQELARSILADGLTAVIHQKLIKGSQPGKRVVSAEAFFVNDDPGIKSKIRSGKLELLSSDIVSQNHRISKGQLPF